MAMNRKQRVFNTVVLALLVEQQNGGSVRAEYNSARTAYSGRETSPTSTNKPNRIRTVVVDRRQTKLDRENVTYVTLGKDEEADQ